MRVIETPAFRDWPFHGKAIAGNYFGQFVLLSLDPVASVAALEDPIATQAAAKLPRGKYLALVVNIGRDIMILNPDDEYKLNLDFWMIGDGPPTERPAASIPIAPASSHPDGRPAVTPSVPLPWSNLYVHSFFNLSSAVSRVHIGNNPCDSRLTFDVIHTMRVQRIDDKAKLQSEEAAAELEDAQGASSVRTGTPSNHRLESGSSSLVMDEFEPEVDKDLQAIREKLGQMVVYVELWLDLSDHDGVDQAFGVPKDFLPPLHELQRIWADWEERAMTEYLAKRPQTTAWAQEVASRAVHEDGTAEARDSVVDAQHHRDVDDDDNAIFPEDAVDYTLQPEEGEPVARTPWDIELIVPKSDAGARSVVLSTSPAQIDHVSPPPTNVVQASPSSERLLTTSQVVQDPQHSASVRVSSASQAEHDRFADHRIRPGSTSLFVFKTYSHAPTAPKRGALVQRGFAYILSSCRALFQRRESPFRSDVKARP
ncbi:hypothetical protein EXIGLDRAFT_725498 [Exidia glandulosa HHB12029]|uniref:Uncharacterized protein n=1 Tax=Exidia glandulosa HHB12029 TaxID=1314781 RepID=A0A165E094_EXIGL|nr:hypothetical protein EXIGLDRAFT_725498 [Exidia glandulosa HHB12029]